MDAALTQMPPATPVPQSGAAATTVASSVKAGMPKHATTKDTADILGRVEVPADLCAVLMEPGKRGSCWTRAEVEKVFDWIKDSKRQAFQALFAFLRRRLQLTAGRVRLHSNHTGRLEEALEQEATDQLLDFLDCKFETAVKAFVPGQCSSFLSHLYAHLRYFADGELPQTLKDILLQPERNTSQNQRIVQWIADNWKQRLVQVARTHLSPSSKAEDADEVVQAYFESKPKKKKAAKQESPIVRAEAEKVVQNFNAEKATLWYYLRLCFLRYWYRFQRSVAKRARTEVPIPVITDPDSGVTEIELSDTHGLSPDKLCQLEERRKILERCIARLREKQQAVILATMEGTKLADIAARLKITVNHAQQLNFRARTALRRMPEIQGFWND